ncbi:unnamed protein product [Phaeothamnion confervicola]
MVKLDVTCMRHLSKNDFRVLTAVEMGMRNHDVVPIELITSIAKLRHGGTHRIIATLATYKLIAHDRSVYDGYRLTYQGYDILALHVLLSRGHVAAVGAKIGVGKESDVYAAQSPDGEEIVLKLHRLGRTSFKAVRNKRDYLKHRVGAGWLYMSRLSALKEAAFMRALHANGFPTPVPIDHNRHAVLMSMARGYPLYQIRRGELPDPAAVFAQAAAVLTRLAQHGLVHCDLNEFNLIVDHAGCTVTVIDFPQMVSTRHANAEELFHRDLNGILKFFRMKLGYAPPVTDVPDWAVATARGASNDAADDVAAVRLDEAVKASGFGNAEQRELEEWRAAQPPAGDNNGDASDDEEGNDDDGSEEEEEGEGGDDDTAAAGDGGDGYSGRRGADGGAALGADSCGGSSSGLVAPKAFVPLGGYNKELSTGAAAEPSDGFSGGSDGSSAAGVASDDGSDNDGDVAADGDVQRGDGSTAPPAGLAAAADVEEDGGMANRVLRVRGGKEGCAVAGKASRNHQKMRVRGKKMRKGQDF